MTTGQVDFLVIGTARSGTTLVQRLCCELPDVWVPPETHFWPLGAEAADRFEFPLRSHNRVEMVSWLLDELGERTLPVRPTAVVDEIGKRDRRAGLWVVFESLVAAMSPPVTRLGEKTPGHAAHWEQLTQAIPHLKLIGIVRDPRAVLRSHRTVPWGDHDAWTLAEKWVAHQRSLEDAARLLGPDRVLLITYEDLVETPDEHQSTIAAFLDVDDEPEPLDAEMLDRHPLFPEREGWKSKALGSITTDHTSLEDGDLTEDDLAIVESVAGLEMSRYGYSQSTDREPPPMGRESWSNVMAFRHWYALATASAGLPIT